MEIVSEIRAEILQQIGVGEGRNSTVYLARDLQLNGHIALKEVPLDQFENPDEYFREAVTLFATACSRVVPVQYACKGDDCVRIAMPYFAKGSLSKIIQRHPLTTREIVTYGQHILAGLHHIHATGFVHFDIKPTNILIGNDGTALVSDFGQSRRVNDLGVASVPPLYLYHWPPECLVSNMTTKLSDIYQVGLTLYRLANGDAFFKSQVHPSSSRDRLSQLIATGHFPRRDRFLAHVPSSLRRVIRKALQLDPSRRYQTALEMADALGRVDSLLDWQYRWDGIGHLWFRRSATHEWRIIMEPDAHGWRIKGCTIRLSDNLTRARKPWNCGPLPLRKAEQVIRRVFQDMEAEQ